MKEPIEDYFIPNKRNKYAPHGLQKMAMIGMLALIVLSFTTANVQSLIWISSKWMISTVLPAVIVDLTNEERQDEALVTLRRNAVLDEAARLKAEHMAKNEYFAHYSPDGVSPWYWFDQVSYNFVHAGENLAIHFTDSGDVVKAWMESPTHRANIMNGNYLEIGVGTAEGTYEGYPTVYVVQLFGAPGASAVAVAPAVPEVAGQELTVTPVQEEEVLSESVSLSEDVVIYEAEPEAIVIEEEVIIPSEQIQEQQDQAVITDMVSTPYGVALYSDLISTSTGGVPATIAPSDTDNHAPFYMELATQPHVILQILYIVIGLFVLVSLLISILIEARHQQPIQIAYGIGLLIIMGALYFIHMTVSNGALIV